jgi:hypothetical protein
MARTENKKGESLFIGSPMIRAALSFTPLTPAFHACISLCLVCVVPKVGNVSSS